MRPLEAETPVLGFADVVDVRLAAVLPLSKDLVLHLQKLQARDLGLETTSLSFFVPPGDLPGSTLGVHVHHDLHAIPMPHGVPRVSAHGPVPAVALAVWAQELVLDKGITVPDAGIECCFPPAHDQDLETLPACLPDCDVLDESETIPLHLLGRPLVPSAGDPEHLWRPVGARPSAVGGLLGRVRDDNSPCRGRCARDGLGLWRWQRRDLGVPAEMHRPAETGSNFGVKLARLEEGLHRQHPLCRLSRSCFSLHCDTMAWQRLEVNLAYQVDDHAPVSAGLQLALVILRAKGLEQILQKLPDRLQARRHPRIPHPKGQTEDIESDSGDVSVPGNNLQARRDWAAQVLVLLLALVEDALRLQRNLLRPRARVLRDGREGTA
mmetsp:Transcript_45759/g.141570  ORF Transcript_45759/g.141570 Transcript_45759/m.141570 type:complete len:380 (-) Transcript_45759:153-1292(-)